MSNRIRGQRRAVLKALGAGAALAATAGCAPMAARVPRYPRHYSRKPWALPRISMENVIRVIVGHRPYRPSGFVVRSEKFDDKIVVHNYGHGGAGITLSWGSSALAVRETRGMTPGDVAVIGSGVMGLTSARLLQDAGWNVTIHTRDMARHTTSNVAGGEWGPFSVHDAEVSTPAFKSQLDFAARISHHAHTNLGGMDYGIRWTELYYLRETPWEESEDRFPDLYPYGRNLSRDEHPFDSPHVHATVTMMVEPAIFLRRLTEDFLQAGGRFVIRDFESKEDIFTLPETLIFNCTGLGTAKLFGDTELTPAKGQLVYMPPDPAVDYLTIGGGSSNLYMFSRSDVLLLGGTFKPGDYTTHPEPDETARIVSEHQRIFGRFG